MTKQTRKVKRKGLRELWGMHIPKEIEKELPNVENRFNKFEEKFDEAYPRSSPDRIRTEALLYLLETPLTLFLIGHNAAGIVELHGWLERFVLSEIPKRIARDEASQKIVQDLIKRRTLSEMTDIIIALGRWEQSDKVFVNKLKNIRDGIVHKNFELLRKHLGGGKKYSSREISELINKIDWISYLITTMQLLTKLMLIRRKRNKPSI